MPKHSAGIVVYRKKADSAEVLLVHPGGPFWAKKTGPGGWSIPKGEFEESEEPFEVAKREFQEEIGQQAPEGEFLELGEITQKGGKKVSAWAVEKDLGEITPVSNTFSIEWPPRSGNQQEFPEVDKAAWMELSKAVNWVHPGQDDLINRLAEKLGIKLSADQSPDPGLSSQQISLL